MRFNYDPGCPVLEQAMHSKSQKIHSLTRWAHIFKAYIESAIHEKGYPNVRMAVGKPKIDPEETNGEMLIIKITPAGTYQDKKSFKTHYEEIYEGFLDKYDSRLSKDLGEWICGTAPDGNFMIGFFTPYKKER